MGRRKKKRGVEKKTVCKENVVTASSEEQSPDFNGWSPTSPLTRLRQNIRRADLEILVEEEEFLGRGDRDNNDDVGDEGEGPDS